MLLVVPLLLILEAILILTKLTLLYSSQQLSLFNFKIWNTLQENEMI